jgi:hypothetical protein
VVRREVFKLHPIYRREYERAFRDFVKRLPPNQVERTQAELREEFIHSSQAAKICRRWGLSLALHPDDELWDSDPKTAPILFADPGRAVKIIPLGPIRFNPPSSEPWDLNDLSPAMVEACDPSQLDITPILREGRYLRVEIDLLKSMGQIEVEIKEEVESFQAQIHRSPKFEVGPQSILSKIPFESIEWFWKLRLPRDDQANIGKKPGRGPSLDIYLDEQSDIGPVTIFQIWKMNKQEGKSPWKITQDLYPRLRTLTAKKCTKENCLEYIDFQGVSDSKKEIYKNEFCGRKDSCLIAKALLKSVRDAITKTERLIASLKPIE